MAISSKNNKKGSQVQIDINLEELESILVSLSEKEFESWSWFMKRIVEVEKELRKLERKLFPTIQNMESAKSKKEYIQGLYESQSKRNDFFRELRHKLSVMNRG